MSNASLKEQLAAVASQLSDVEVKEVKRTDKPRQKRPNIQRVTPSTPTTTKPRWLDYAQYGVELLKAYFPECFKSMAEVKPLKKGIKEDLVKQLSTMSAIVTEDKACMVKSLSYYVNTSSYYKSMVEGVARIDLHGQTMEPVTAEEAKYATDRQKAKIHNKNPQRAMKENTQEN